MHKKWLNLLIILSVLIITRPNSIAQQEKVSQADVSVQEEGPPDSQLEINRITILEGKSEDIRIKAASLILIDESDQARRILMDIMRDEKNPSARMAVCKALSRTRTERQEIKNKADFIDSLVSILVTSEDSSEVKVAAEAMLIFDYGQISAQLERTAGDKSSPLKARMNAIYALKLQPDMRATIQIIKLVDDGDKQVAAEAERTLKSLGISYGRDAAERKGIITELESRGKERFLQERLIWQESNMERLDVKNRLWRERYLASLDKLYNAVTDDTSRGKMLAEYLSDKEYEVRLWAVNKVYKWWVGTEPGTNLLVDLGPALIKLISDPERDVRLKTATLLSLISKLDTAGALAEQFKVESDDEVKTEIFVALGWSCYYATLPNASTKVSLELRRQTLKWAQGYLSERSPQKAQKGAEVITKLLEQDGLTESEVDGYLGVLSKRYLEQKVVGEDGLCAELLGAMASICGQSVYKDKAAGLYRPLFEEALNSLSDLSVQRSADGLISIDKGIALKRLREGLANYKSPEMRQKIIELAGAVGGKEDLVWLSERIGSAAENKAAWQAMLKIFKRSDSETIETWFKQLQGKSGENRPTDEQMLSFFETAEGKIAADKNAKLLRDIQEQMAGLYKKGGDCERAAKYYGILLKSEPPLGESEQEIYMGQLLDVYLKCKNIESAKQLITNRLLASDIDSENPLANTIKDYMGNVSVGTDPNSLLTALSQIKTEESRPMWSALLKQWSERSIKAAEPNAPIEKKELKT